MLYTKYSTLNLKYQVKLCVVTTESLVTRQPLQMFFKMNLNSRKPISELRNTPWTSTQKTSGFATCSSFPFNFYQVYLCKKLKRIWLIYQITLFTYLNFFSPATSYRYHQDKGYKEDKANAVFSFYKKKNANHKAHTLVNNMCLNAHKIAANTDTFGNKGILIRYVNGRPAKQFQIKLCYHKSLEFYCTPNAKNHFILLFLSSFFRILGFASKTLGSN